MHKESSTNTQWVDKEASDMQPGSGWRFLPTPPLSVGASFWRPLPKVPLRLVRGGASGGGGDSAPPARYPDTP